MAEQTFKIEFDGYWRDETKDSIPAESGVYCVYEGTRDEKEKTVTLHTLIYIGESEDVRGRLSDHERQEDWLKHVRQGNKLYFSFGPVEDANRVRCEAALIFKHKPPENTEYRDTFPFDKTTMVLSGQTSHLIANFVVTRS